MRLAASIIKNKTLLIALIIACVVVVILGIVIVIKLVPWVFSLFGYLEQGGAQRHRRYGAQNLERCMGRRW